MDRQSYAAKPAQQQQHSNQAQFQHPNEQPLARQDSPSSCGSPRRRKPTLDIDAALYLQSQASYVQEPAKRGGDQSIAGVSSSISTKDTCGGGVSSSSNNNNINHINQINNSNNIVAGKPPVLARPPVGRKESRPVGYHDYNISVDYIDCIANTGPEELLPVGQLACGQEASMRGLSSCGRRRFSRLNRAHRVEPSAANDTNVSTPTTNDSSSIMILNNSQQPQLVGPSESSSVVTTNSLGDTEPTSLAIQQQSTSVLYPISVSEVKKRTYFIGSVSQNSLLGQDELYRYFPQGRVNIFVCTWNQNRKRAPTNLNDLLLPDQLIYMPDIYAIGIQEAFSSQADYLREWDIELQTTLGPNHVLLHSCSLGVLHLSIFVRRDLIWFCSTPEESLYNSRSMPTNMIKTKGAISIAFRFFGTSFMFTNCHFPAHENKLRDRIEEYQRIINSIDLPKNLKLLKPRYLSNDSTARFDCVFFMGDLNFRLEQRTFDETIQIMDDIFQSQGEHNFEILTQNDELLKVMETQQAFHGFDESQIRFPPTYKFLAQTNKYDRQSKRVPSYTDRILFRSKRQRHIQCLIYNWLPQLLSSDHKPVYCLFDVLVRPGREQNMVSTLNAGLFQRAIYIEALKRRAEDPEGLGRENGPGGNLICSIS